MRIIDRLHRLLDDPDRNQEWLADKAGVTQATVSRWLGGSDPRGANRDKIIEIYDSVFGEGEPAGVTVGVMGYLGAGAEVEPDYEQVPGEGLEQVALPFPVPADMIAFKVKGVSMMPVYRPDTIIVVYREQKKPIESFYGMEAAVRTAEGRRFIKTVTRGGIPNTVTLTSWNDAMPLENQRLVWIGEIFAALPPQAVRQVARSGGIQGQLKLKA